MLLIQCDDCDREVFDSRKDKANEEYKILNLERHTEYLCLDCFEERKKEVSDMSKNEIIDNLYELSQCVLEVASDLEKDKMDIDDVPKCFMELIDDSEKESEVE